MMLRVLTGHLSSLPRRRQQKQGFPYLVGKVGYDVIEILDMPSHALEPKCWDPATMNSKWTASTRRHHEPYSEPLWTAQLLSERLNTSHKPPRLMIEILHDCIYIYQNRPKTEYTYTHICIYVNMCIYTHMYVWCPFTWATVGTQRASKPLDSSLGCVWGT